MIAYLVKGPFQINNQKFELEFQIIFRNKN